VVDYLNLELGIVHQDIALRHLLIDSITNKIRLFDFDRAAPISQAKPTRNDIAGVLFTRFRDHLNDWVRKRKDNREVPDQNQGPQTPSVPPPSPLLVRYNETGEPIYNTSDSRRRSDKLKQKKNISIWECPTQPQSN
jgi:hypothetical protein